eukprot:TRINITY_DN20751_c0_g1_i1.p1 TRINITY_DN20751_c0_g1~~TRINITY_DN20751_c0_g1_i1.p1  ORF type:complete len:454 (+),score=82.04 TRINITY_DN20751_c0_g1_i1:199-1560(+)
MAGTVVVFDISDACPNRMQLFTCVFGWIDSLSKQSPLERVALCSTFNPQNPSGLPPSRVKTEPGVKGEPQVKLEGRPAKRKRESPANQEGGALTVLVPLKRYLQDLSMIQTAMAALEHVDPKPCCSWSDAVSAAAQMLVDCFGQSPVGQIVIISDQVPVLDGPHASRFRLPLGIRPHQFTLVDETQKSAAALSSLHRMTQRHQGTSSEAGDLEGLMHAMDEMQIECLRPHDAQIAMGHLRTRIQVIPSIGPPLLSAVGCPHQPGVFSIVGFIPLSQADMLPVLSVHHAVLYTVGMGDDGAELYIGLQTVLQRDRLAAIVRLTENVLAVFTSLAGITSQGGARRCLVLSLLAPDAETPELPAQPRRTACFPGTEVAMPLAACLESQKKAVAKAVEKAPSKLTTRVKQAVAMAESLSWPIYLEDIRELINNSNNSEVNKLLESAQTSIEQTFQSK